MSSSQHAVVTARSMGVIACPVCRQVCRLPATDDNGRCPRCRTHLSRRKPHSLGRTCALLLTSILLYIPANILPVVRTGSLFSNSDNTILGGVIELWRLGSADLAIIVFSASIVVPILKFFALGWLLIVVHGRNKGWAVARQRGRLYRLIEGVGHWSMLDVFVVALLTGAIQLAPVARIEPLPGITWFALVVMFMMLASMSFDPRLLWDSGKEKT